MIIAVFFLRDLRFFFFFLTGLPSASNSTSAFFAFFFLAAFLVVFFFAAFFFAAFFVVFLVVLATFLVVFFFAIIGTARAGYISCGLAPHHSRKSQIGHHLSRLNFANVDGRFTGRFTGKSGPGPIPGHQATAQSPKELKIIHSTPIAEFHDLAADIPVIDVRAPVEFAKGHYPPAINIPLFSDEERAEIGTRYKKNGQPAAIELGYQYANPKKDSLIASVRNAVESHTPKAVAAQRPQIRLHCWRGGMRSQKFAELLDPHFEIFLLEGGYKSYRQFAQKIFQRDYPLLVLSGLTGAGKTRQLHRLAETGEQVIDLEGLANHRGSAFGGIDQGPQPTTEQFENELASLLSRVDLDRRIWIEDESNRIGSVVIPHEFFKQINGGPGIFMEVDRATRARLAHEDYADLDLEEMVASIGRITKKLGGQNAKAAIEAIQSNDKVTCCEILLDYYDRLYLAATKRGTREVCHNVPVANPETLEAANTLIAAANAKYPTRLLKQ